MTLLRLARDLEFPNIGSNLWKRKRSLNLRLVYLLKLKITLDVLTLIGQWNSNNAPFVKTKKGFSQTNVRPLLISFSKARHNYLPGWPSCTLSVPVCVLGKTPNSFRWMELTFERVKRWMLSGNAIECMER